MLQILGGVILGIIVLILVAAVGAQDEPDDTGRGAVEANVVLQTEPFSLAHGGLETALPGPEVAPQLDSMER